jgi:hypothetical protein
MMIRTEATLMACETIEWLRMMAILQKVRSVCSCKHFNEINIDVSTARLYDSYFNLGGLMFYHDCSMALSYAKINFN